MSLYGDRDPEDSYDAGDPLDVRLDVLERIVADLYARDDRRGQRRRDALRLVDNLEHVSSVDRPRLARVRRDLAGL